MNIIDGRKIRDKVLEKVKREVSALPFRPVFCDVLVGEDPASVQYVEMKERMAEAVGLKFHKANFPASISTDDLINEIRALNKVENMCGIIVQLPLPSHIERKSVLDAIAPDLDVDCLGVQASEKFYNGTGGAISFPAAIACMEILDSLNLDLNMKRIVVLGQGILVGRPVTAILKSRGLSPEVVTSGEEKEKIIKEADIIISGIGKGKYITGDMIKDEVVIIDAGTSESEGSIVGDVDFESVKNVAGFISPVPGGVGPVTVAMLMRNVLTVAKNIK
jgi:methylenetetrahydrofolate dehydrogenase (NADP+)/methenyltetrahydrofolate cyclohydrolase